LIVLSGGAALVLRPYAASPDAVATKISDSSVIVADANGIISFVPAGEPASVGLIFYPGGLVDPVAYAGYMRAFAEAGFAAFIVRMPLHFAVLDIEAGSKVIAAHPEISTWIVGGHSLGGAMAARYADSHPETIKGLLLWATYAESQLNLENRADLRVLSVYGTEDQLTTVDIINETKANLPASTTYVAIEGGNHAYFGDYGPQARDGQPTISREEAFNLVLNATLTFFKQF
jgi:hypothetical protein